MQVQCRVQKVLVAQNGPLLEKERVQGRTLGRLQPWSQSSGNGESQGCSKGESEGCCSKGEGEKMKGGGGCSRGHAAGVVAAGTGGDSLSCSRLLVVAAPVQPNFRNATLAR